MLGAGLIAVGREGGGNRHAVFFTPLMNPWGTEDEEEYCYDVFTKPRKVHCKIVWKHSQDAVYWIHFGRAQEKGTAF